MRGSIRKRYKNSWSIVLDAYEPDPATGKPKRKRKWHSVKGTKKDAERRLAELLHQANTGTLIDASKSTVAEWLNDWLEATIKPRKRERTYGAYKTAVANHLNPAIGHIRLQQLQPQHIQGYYAASNLAERTLALHHAILSGALKAALMQGQVSRNAATLVMAKPRQFATGEETDIRDKCWALDEARKFLAVCGVTGPQMEAFYHLALDSGARKSELCGLTWSEVDLDQGTVRITRQLLRSTSPPTFGPPKNGSPRVITLMPQTVGFLRRHRAQQAETKLANRHIYHDHDLVFARDWRNPKTECLGYPFSLGSVGRLAFKRLMAEAGVKDIVFHGLRHTSGSLLLQAGVPPHVVQQRLGHKNLNTTMSVYAHILPDMQQDAATKLAAVMHPEKRAIL